MNKIRTRTVLFILHIPPPVHGAAMVGQYIVNSEVVNSNFNCKYINLGTSRSVDEIGKNGIKKWLRYLTILYKTIVTIIRFRPNLVYLTLTATGSGFYKDAAIALIVKVLRRKVVYHFHNKGVSFRQDKVFDNWLYKRVFKKSNVILLSKYLYGDIKKYVSEQQVQYCPNGIPSSLQEKNENKEGKNQRIEIIFLSNLIVSKGVFVLLEACKILKSRKIDFHCNFIGSEGNINIDEFNEISNELGLNSNVSYLGCKFGDEKAAALKNADILTLPTQDDCFPLVLLEAMQMSLPVVSSYEGGIPDIVENGETGYLVRKNDPEHLSDMLEILIKDKELRLNMGQAGKIKFHNEYTIEVFENRLSDILTGILDKK